MIDEKTKKRLEKEIDTNLARKKELEIKYKSRTISKQEKKELSQLNFVKEKYLDEYLEGLKRFKLLSKKRIVSRASWNGKNWKFKAQESFFIQYFLRSEMNSSDHQRIVIDSLYQIIEVLEKRVINLENQFEVYNPRLLKVEGKGEVKPLKFKGDW